MKASFCFLLSIALMLIGTGNLNAQGIDGGIVKYEQLIKYDFSSIPDNQEWNNFISRLPKEGKAINVLNFTDKVAFYEIDPTVKVAQSERLQRAINVSNRRKPPKPVLKKVYYEFEKGKKIELVEFMMRDFLVKSNIEKQGWKINDKRKKVLEYNCLGAEKQEGNRTITAWFSSEIPISSGPAEYYGLPGLILEVEIYGVIAYTATSIDMTPPKERSLLLPKNGKKVSQKEFDRIVKKKVEEFEKDAALGIDRERRRERNREGEKERDRDR